MRWVFSKFRSDNNYQMLQLLAKHRLDVNYCRTPEEPNELLHSLFSPSILHLLLRYGLTRTPLSKRVTSIASLAYRSIWWLHWYHNVLPVVIDVIERNSVVRDHMTALSHHIESTYKVRFGIDDYNPAVWRPIFDLFERPHSLKECVLLHQVDHCLRPGSREYWHIVLYHSLMMCTELNAHSLTTVRLTKCQGLALTFKEIDHFVKGEKWKKYGNVKEKITKNTVFKE